MTAATTQKLQKVQKYSASLRSLFVFMFVMGVVVWLITTVMTFSDAIRPNSASRAIGYLYQSLGVAIVLKLTFHLASLFGLYATGKIFSAENVRQIRQIGITLLLFPALAVLGLFVPLPVPAEGISSDGPPVFVQFIAALQNVIFGVIVIIISWIMDVGRELREEQDLVV